VFPRYMKKEKPQKFYIYSDVTHTHAWQTVCRLWVTSCFPSRDLEIPVEGLFQHKRKMKLLWWTLFEETAETESVLYWIETVVHGAEWNDEKLQVRGVDQTPYPSLLHGASLDFVGDRHAATLSQGRAVQSLSMVLPMHSKQRFSKRGIC
jgi:hypothetical protein